ncbi:MAG: arginine-tRNA-protein transferase [Bacteroidetes bacterium]|nr:arginine-tRNA-protein transferase [Bacteroidota bacterium]
MTYYNIHYPVTMPGPLLDEYLSKGWYRMQQTIFTTDIIIKNDHIIPVFWLRLVLKKYQEAKKSRKIMELNQGFSVKLKSGRITDEAEALYALYKAAVDFDVSESIRDYLVGESPESIYHTHCYEVRDGKKLVACGYFDEGASSLAGILNIYHPDYKQMSPGKFLMLLKINYALQQEKQYYYPGYISTGITKFDYKLFPGKESAEVFISRTGQWVPWLSVTKEQLEESLFAGEDDQ